MSNILDSTKGDFYLKGIRDGSIKQGLGIACRLDQNLRFKVGTFNIILGRSNVGKTDWIIWYLVCLSVKHKLRWLIFSSENSIGNIKQKIIQFKTGKGLKQLSEDEFNEANNWLSSKFQFFDTERLYTAYELLETFDELKDSYDGIMIDPYNSLIRTGNTHAHDYDYKVASEMRIFCQKFKKTIYIISHPVTDSLRKKHGKGHQYVGYPMPSDEADIEGGGKWISRADDFIVVHRYISTISSMKCLNHRCGNWPFSPSTKSAEPILITSRFPALNCGIFTVTLNI